MNDHYRRTRLETIEGINGLTTEDEFDGYIKGNIIKYITRARHKGYFSTDIIKAIDYALIWLNVEVQDREDIINNIRNVIWSDLSSAVGMSCNQAKEMSNKIEPFFEEEIVKPEVSE